MTFRVELLSFTIFFYRLQLNTVEFIRKKKVISQPSTVQPSIDQLIRISLILHSIQKLVHFTINKKKNKRPTR